MIREQLRSAVVIFILLTVITGVAYPSLVTGIAQLFFPREANGSIISYNGKTLGSSLIGQSFDGPKYMWGRLSATSPVPYNAASSSGSNLGPSNPIFLDAVKARRAALRSADPYNDRPIPIDLLTASGSGLDPHISEAGAYYQAPRIARVRGYPESVVRDIIRRNTMERLFGVIGEPVVNVLKVNLDLDRAGAEYLQKDKK